MRPEISSMTKCAYLIGIYLVSSIWSASTVAANCQSSPVKTDSLFSLKWIFKEMKANRLGSCEQQTYNNELLNLDAEYFQQSTDLDYRNEIKSLKSETKTLKLEPKQKSVTTTIASDSQIKTDNETQMPRLPGYKTIGQTDRQNLVNK